MNQLKLFLVVNMLLWNTTLQANVNVFACEPEWQSLARELGGEHVETYSATTAYQDPHHIEARPSLIAKLRRADLLICSGAELEAGWLPLLIRQAANPRVQSGQAGYFMASDIVDKLGIPDKVDRRQGDVHAAGNPHVHLDPRRIAIIARALHERLINIDPTNASAYTRRYETFSQRWQQAIPRWELQARPLQGSGVVVHHLDWLYLFDWLAIEIVGALEPRPGLPTTAGHLTTLKDQLINSPASMIVHTAYQNPRAAQRLSGLTHIPVIELPYTVGGHKEATDLFSLFDVTIEKLLEAVK